MPRSRLLLAVVAALSVLAAGAAIGWAVGSSGKGEPVVREALAQSSKVRGVKGRTLALSRVTIRPGATIPLHHHPGTQVSYIDRGTLTYSVETGSVKVMKGASDDHPTLVRRIKAGQTGRIKAGRWIVEQPNEKHHAANRGDRRVVIYLSTLFPKGAPPSIPDEPPAAGR
jgi:quercetin dioxygenase-like cupin family protein